MNYKCLECTSESVWILHTLFCGDLPYCEEHAVKNGLKDSPEWEERE